MFSPGENRTPMQDSALVSIYCTGVLTIHGKYPGPGDCFLCNESFLLQVKCVEFCLFFTVSVLSDI